MKKLSEEKDGDLSTMSMFSCQCWQQLEDYILRNTTRIWIPVGRSWAALRVDSTFV